ncbi:MAG: glutaredoxin domain-containing protein [Methylovirgula sp.]
MPQPHIVIYTTASCPYCHRAKALLNERGLAFEEISVDGDPGSARNDDGAGQRPLHRAADFLWRPPYRWV